MAATQIFVSYSHADRSWLDPSSPHGLIPWLAQALRNDDAVVWHDRSGIEPGVEFQHVIEQEIRRSQFALLLISEAYLYTDFINQVELPLIKEKAMAHEMEIIPILLEPCEWTNCEIIHNRQIVPGSLTPLIDYTDTRSGWANARFEILTAVRERIQHLRKQPDSGIESAAAAPLTQEQGDVEESLPGPTRVPESSGPLVFISAKSQDYPVAQRYHEHLTKCGIRCFLGEVSLKELGISDYREAIDDALDEATHMIVVTSSRENVRSSWVKAEWGLFINEKRSDRKSGNLVTIIVGDMQIKDLPASLRYYEVIPDGPESFEKTLIYVGRHVRSEARPSDAPLKRDQTEPAEESQSQPQCTEPASTNSLAGHLVDVPKDRLAGGDRSEGLPKQWTTAERQVVVATPEGDVEKRLSYHFNTVRMEFVLIPGGEFGVVRRFKGKGSEEAVAKRYRVQITKPYYMSAHAVTFGEFQQFVKSTGYRTDAERGKAYRKWARRWTGNGWAHERRVNWLHPPYDQTETCPVVCASWNDATEFAKWLSAKEGLDYFLPTDAEWEYACRSGTTTRYYWGKEFRQDCAWVGSNSGKRPQPVGKKLPNAFGLHDMSGNVWEWCSDWYAADGIPTAIDPSGPVSGSERILRGASWWNKPSNCASANRFMMPPSLACVLAGFRLACRVKQQ